jgi:hypothetical protein
MMTLEISFDLMVGLILSKSHPVRVLPEPGSDLTGT